MLTKINVLFASFILQQARNQEYFRAGEFPSNLGTSKNIHLQHEKERPRREEVYGFFYFKLRNFTHR